MTERPDREHHDARPPADEDAPAQDADRVASDGPDEGSGPGGFRPRVIAGGAAASDEAAEHEAADPGAPSLDEDALRRLLHESVQDLEPDPTALEHLRRAVPARQARHRQVLAGVAAAVLVGGAAVPALFSTRSDLRRTTPSHACRRA